jgi:hypothetical protein
MRIWIGPKNSTILALYSNSSNYHAPSKFHSIFGCFLLSLHSEIGSRQESCWCFLILISFFFSVHLQMAVARRSHVCVQSHVTFVTDRNIQTFLLWSRSHSKVMATCGIISQKSKPDRVKNCWHHVHSGSGAWSPHSVVLRPRKNF